jgi:DNA-binding IclR family transcriptional regulator
MQPKTKTHQSVGKALEIVKSFIPDNRERSTVGLAHELGLNNSTVSRLLGVLTVHGFLQQNPNNKKYSLGKVALFLGKAVHKSISEQIVVIAKPHIDKLRDLIELDTGLEVLLNKETILAYRAWGPQQYKFRFSIGERLAVHAAAGARVIMAFSPPEVVDSMLKGKLDRITPKTVTDRKTLKKKLDEYRKIGVAFDMGEMDEDYVNAAAPIFNYERKPVAAVVIGESARKIKGRFDTGLIKALKETAAKISSDLFYPRDGDY